MSKKYDNSGSLGKNPNKSQDKHPDYKGKATINGVEYWLSGWAKKGEFGPWISLSFQPKDEQRKPANNPAFAQGNNFVEDDMPF